MKRYVRSAAYKLYHGSPNSNIVELDFDHIGKNTETHENFIFFTDSPEFAEEFSYERLPTSSRYLNAKGSKGRVYIAEVTLNHPLDLTSPTADDIKNLIELSDGELTVDMIERFSHKNNQLLKAFIDLDKIVDYGYDGFSIVSVNVTPNMAESTFTENGTYIADDYGYDGFSEITIDVSANATALIDRTIESIYDSSVSAIGLYAFAGCNNLQTISFPNCTLIYSHAFDGCYSLSQVYFVGNSAPTLVEDPFTDAAIGAIYVNPDLVSDYKQDEYWGLYSDYIVAYSE